METVNGSLSRSTRDRGIIETRREISRDPNCI
jgi:hypothetical protein